MDYAKFNDEQILAILSNFGAPKKLKVLYISTYLADYIRTEAVLGILKRNSVQVIPVLVGYSRIKYFLAVLNIVLRYKEYDIVFLSFRGQEILPFIRLATKKPVIFDAFVSIYDTLCLDRRLFRPWSLIGKILKRFDTYLCNISDIVLVDTQAHAEYFKNEFKAKNVSYLYLECDKDLFKPVEVIRETDKFIVFWYGNCWPLQGVEVILKAAWRLKSERDIVFRIAGPVRAKYSALVKETGYSNIEFIDFVPYNELPLVIAKADVCLGGHFSDRPKAKRVISGKAFQFISCGKKVILGDNKANRELFEERQGVYFVEMGSDEALAGKILEIKEKSSCYK